MFAEIVLGDLESKLIEDLNSSILYNRRYIDDCFLIIKEDEIEVLNTFNLYNKYIRFHG